MIKILPSVISLYNCILPLSHQGVVLMSVQTGLAPPNTGRAKPVCADIRTTPSRPTDLNIYMLLEEELVVFMYD